MFVQSTFHSRFLLQSIVVPVVFAIAACSAASGNTTTTSQAAKGMEAGGEGLYAAFYHATITGPGPISYSTPGISMTGTLTAGAGTPPTLQANF
jgi:hypothetical protein